tara:strand:- start:179 stop:466 length:288 start_codon:yes stop_codon:yes gene_type:complete
MDKAAEVIFGSGALFVLDHRTIAITKINIANSSNIVEATVPSSNILMDETMDQSSKRTDVAEKDLVPTDDSPPITLFFLCIVCPMKSMTTKRVDQ